MAKYKILALFSALTLTVSTALLAVAPSRAHFQNAPSTGIIYSSAYGQAQSEYLFSDGGKVDLGILTNEINVPITVTVPKGSVTGKVTCTVDRDDTSLVSATVFPESDFELTDAAPATVDFSVQLKDGVRAQIAEPREITVNIKYEYKIGKTRYSMQSDFTARINPESYTADNELFFNNSNITKSPTEIFDDGKCFALASDLFLITYKIPVGTSGALTTVISGVHSLPTSTKYLTNDGACVLYSGGYIKLSPDSTGEGVLVVDMSGTVYAGENNFTFAVEALDGDSIYRDTVTIGRSTAPKPFEANMIRQTPIIVVPDDPLTRDNSTAEAVIELCGNTVLTDPMWNSHDGPSQYKFSVEKMADCGWTTEDDGIAVLFRPKDETTGDIAITADKDTADPGTYRLKISFEYEGIKISEITTPFFVDQR